MKKARPLRSLGDIWALSMSREIQRHWELGSSLRQDMDMSEKDTIPCMYESRTRQWFSENTNPPQLFMDHPKPATVGGLQYLTIRGRFGLNFLPERPTIDHTRYVWARKI
jgi:hypothetical protein